MDVKDQRSKKKKEVQTAFDWKLYHKPQDVLCKLKSDGELIDLILVSEDGAEEQVHQQVIAALGQRFYDLITKSVDSSTSDQGKVGGDSMVKRIQIKGMTKDLLESIVKYAYTGYAECVQHKIIELFEFAVEFQITDLIHCCCRYFQTQINISNCVQHFNIGLKHKHPLSQSAWNFMKINFEQIVKHSDCLTQECILAGLSMQYLIELIDDDHLNVSDEATVLLAVIIWCFARRRNDLLYNFLKVLRYPRIKYAVLTKLLYHPFVSSHEQSKELISKFLSDYNKFKKLDGYRKAVGLSPRCIRPRIPHEILFAIGGWENGVSTTLIETYDIRTNKWFKSKLSHEFPKAYHGTQVVNGIIYIIGGTNGTIILNSVHCFDPVNSKWYHRANLSEARCYVSTVVLDNIIYALGGHNGRDRMRSCEKYNTETDQWTPIHNMNIIRSDASACVCNGKIFIAGGLNGLMIEDTVEYYDPATDTWTHLISLIVPRSSLSLVCYHDSLYAIGGNNGFQRLSQVERYDFTRREWSPAPNMMQRRSTLAGCVFNDAIYVFGGYNGKDAICQVEKYDDKTDRWIEVASMGYQRSGLTVCVVTGLSNGQQYTFSGQISKINKLH